MSIIQRGSLGEFAGAWDALVAQAPLPSPFLRSWWLESIARGRSPRFVLVVEDTRLLGGLALEADRWLGLERLRFLGAGPLSPDHLDLVAAVGREADVVGALAGWLRRPGGRLLDLDGLAEGSRVRPALPRPVRERAAEIAPYALLPRDPDAYLAGLPSKARNTIRRTTRRLEAAGARYRVAEPSEADRALEDLHRLHDQRWAERSGFSADFPAFAAAARRGAERGEVVFHELVVSDEVIACEVTFEVAGRSSFYQGGRAMDDRWRGAGTMLRAAVLARACRTGLTEHDFLRGDEAYKRDWAGESRTLLHLQAATGISGHALLAALRVRSSARSTVTRLRAALGGLRSSRSSPDRGDTP